MSLLTPRTAPAPVADLQGPAKLEEVKRLLGQLQADLEKVHLLTNQRDVALEQLKIYGRDPENADPIFTKDGIDILTRHAFNSPSYTTSRHALRCLANAMLLKPVTRQMFVDLKYESKACNRLKYDSRDDEFLVSRIIFLTTYNTNVNIEEVIDKHHLAENINQNIIRHTACCDEKKRKKINEDPMQDMALTETLKLLFNISHLCPQRSGAFTPAIPHIITMFYKRPVSSNQPLHAPIGALVNSLINLDLKNDEAMHALFPKNEQKAIAERLTVLLNFAVRAYKEEELDQQVSPLIVLVRKIYDLAPQEVKAFMGSSILPSDDDRQQPLGQTESLSSRLLKLSISPLAPQLREEISNLLFELSDKDTRTFVQNIGYGFASGFLFQHNVPIPESSLDAWATSKSDTGSSASSNKININPITGQKTECEPGFDGPEMAKEEKEREAERLFVLFERLKANGVISAENPISKAQREGVFDDPRFQELNSDDDDLD